MILVTGSLAFDFIMNFPGKFSDHILPEKIHTINLSFLVKDLRQERGGCAANIAYNLSLLGEKPAILGVLGNDGRAYKKWLKNQGVDVSMIPFIKTKRTSSGFIMTDLVDNQITGFYPGAMEENKKLKIKNKKHPKPEQVRLGADTLKFKKIRFIVVAPNDPKAMVNFARECQELNIPYLFDPGMQLPRLTKKDLEIGINGAKIVIGNDYEIALIKNKKQITKNKKQIWITTLGEKGSIIDDNGKMIKIKAAKPKNTSDPTGAGDAYRAGFLAGYLRGFDLKTCGQMGSVCAVYTVEKYGTTTHRFSKRQFIKRYKENYGEEIKL
ncbi:carbohydrate kinase family protein [Candidatus Microgenomates bacterium]|nr:carbohydrate kinase family protein [Candidatus Microgenomates bacterium]